MTFLPCGVYHQNYRQDHAFWQTNFVRGKMILLAIVAFALIPLFLADYLSEFILFIYWSMGALGVQLLIGYCGQLTLGHAAFLAVGGYSSFLLMALPWPTFLLDMGVVYPTVLLISAVIAGIWCVIFGLPSARVKGFYLILTTMAAQFITVDFFIAKYISQIGGRQQDLTLSSDLIKIGPWTVDNKFDVYYLGVILLTVMVFAVANHLRSRSGRAWVAVRDNDIAAEAMGINIITYKLRAFFVSGFIGGSPAPTGGLPGTSSAWRILLSANPSGWWGSSSSAAWGASTGSFTGLCSWWCSSGRSRRSSAWWGAPGISSTSRRSPSVWPFVDFCSSSPTGWPTDGGSRRTTSTSGPFPTKEVIATSFSGPQATRPIN